MYNYNAGLVEHSVFTLTSALESRPGLATLSALVISSPGAGSASTRASRSGRELR